jgi:predicted dehydrogenase
VTAPLNVGVVGLGYWGPNLLRNALELEGMSVVAMCDRDPDTLAKHARRHPHVRADTGIDAMLQDDNVDAVVLATPISTHYALATRCLEAGKHVLVEKPMAETVAECDQLVELAARQRRLLMPGLTFLYSPPVVAVKEMLELGELGPLYFGTFSRVNLGIHRSDLSVVRDLAPHDYSILLYWLGCPSHVRAIGRESIVPGVCDVVFIDVRYPGGLLVHIELSWLAPTKIRRVLLVGSAKMVVYEDTSLEQIRVYDRGVDVIEPRGFGEFQLSYRSGDVLSPRLDPDEPLKVELQDFADAIREGREPRASTKLGVDVVRLVECTEISLERGGATIAVTGDEDEGIGETGFDKNVLSLRPRKSRP